MVSGTVLPGTGQVSDTRPGVQDRPCPSGRTDSSCWEGGCCLDHGGVPFLYKTLDSVASGFTVKDGRVSGRTDPAELSREEVEPVSPSVGMATRCLYTCKNEIQISLKREQQLFSATKGFGL